MLPLRDLVSMIKDGSAIRLDGRCNCPNCGAVVESDICEYCGTAFVDYGMIEVGSPFALKLRAPDGTVLLYNACVSRVDALKSVDAVYADNVPYLRISPQEAWTLSVDFEIMSEITREAP